ncbi:MAG TPA: 2-C-methyl-D-erythritol 2,4-cyclodiphosphate synthase [Bacteroidales bacterium]|nr:2-C-methyl-D-erythritol 2,4-cyclodiphosphate synthase [Bacteroidales bacterium]HCB61392.1 2-C-methyl-D-erythritol 2,4-cyclodiphosphate synthase [Bacteroidales bacterium]HCY23373.1 2-C-methyl-D-erythritol 2,4-cyclodiphosphate synthase [Bacteroidales bacterium]
MRQGIGYDLHRTVPGRPLIIGGVNIPSDFGLSGHSDADVLIHALCDALLGALALGDIGSHFPDTDPAYKGIDSMILLKKTMELVSAAGYKIINIDAVVVAERPKLMPFKMQMAENIAAALNTDRTHVSVKAKTNEGVDAVGRGEAISAQVVVLLFKNP